jgi:hypothetical protein
MDSRERGGPIATATAVLTAWLSRAGVTATVAPPGGEVTGPAAVCVWPMAVLPEQEVRGTVGRGQLRLRVRYLLTTAAPPAGAADLLDRILLASLIEGDVRIPIKPVGEQVWRAFGLAPELGLYAEVLSRVARPEPRPPLVRQPMRVDSTPLAKLFGRVIGPGGVPLPGMRVVVADTGAVTYTDNRGQFAFPALPEGRPVRLLLSGKGLDLVAEVAAPSAEPVVIHCETEEV